MSDAAAVAFLTNLPSEIILDILVRLPIRSIVSCKCVCRKLLELISSDPFAELHLSRSSRSAPGLIVHHLYQDEDFCRIFQFEDGLELHLLHHHCIEFSPKNFIVTSPDADVSMDAGSVNGLFCLHDVASHLDAFYICNPITQDYIALPKTKETVKFPNPVMYGFGVSSSSGDYKLVRITQSTVTSSSGLELMIYTLGTGSWRSSRIQLSDHTCHLRAGSQEGVFLNGNLHWQVRDSEGCDSIVCFDLETEQFNPCFPTFSISGRFGVLGDCLCFCDCRLAEEIVIWVMKEYGVDSWKQEYTISMDKFISWDDTELRFQELIAMNYGEVIPIRVSKDGDIVLFCQDTFLFSYSRKTETAAAIDLFTVDDYEHSQFNLMLHTPSFLSLRRFENENVASF